MRAVMGILVAAVLTMGAVAGPVWAQSEGAAEGEYTLVLPADWQKIEFKDGAGVLRVEYIFRDRSDALLKIKRVRVMEGETAAQVADRDLDQVLRFAPGFVRGKTEALGGSALMGVLAQYEFTRGGRPMLGRNYYLNGPEGNVWVLQFTGDRATLSELRAVTDRMAREFRQK